MKMPLVALLCVCLFGQSTNPIQDLMEDGHFKRARAAVQARYQEAPNDPEMLWRLSRIRQLWGNLEEAQQLAERAVALSPKDARFHFQLAEAAGQKAENASVFHQISLGRQFKKEADLTLQLDPKHIGAMKDIEGTGDGARDRQDRSRGRSRWRSGEVRAAYAFFDPGL